MTTKQAHIKQSLVIILQLGKYPILEVMVVTLITTAASYPNPYTRIDASAMIYELVSECSPFSFNNLCDYELQVNICGLLQGILLLQRPEK